MSPVRFEAEPWASSLTRDDRAPCCGQGGSRGAEAPVGLARRPPRFALLLAAPRAEAGLDPACSRPGRCRGWKAASTSAALARSPWELLRKLRNLPLSASRALFACLCYRLSTDPKVQTPCIVPPALSSSPLNPALTHAGQRGTSSSTGVLALLWLGAGFSLVSPLPEEAEAQSTGSCGQRWHKRVSLVLGVRCSGLFVSLLAELWVRAAGLRLQESAFL